MPMKHPFVTPRFRRSVQRLDVRTDQESELAHAIDDLPPVDISEPTTEKPDLSPDQDSELAHAIDDLLPVDISEPEPTTEIPDLSPDQDSELAHAIDDLLPVDISEPEPTTEIPDLSPDQDSELASQDLVDQKPNGYKIREHVPKVIRHTVLAGLTRLQEPQPEGLVTRGMQAVKPETGLGRAPVLALTNALGLLVVSIAYYLSVLAYSYLLVEICFYAGLLTMIVPNFLRLVSRAPTRQERIVLLCVLVGYCYFVLFMTSPLYFLGFDENLHWRTAADILRTGHLFHENSILPASPYFPGLEIVTNAVSTVTGLSTFYAGNIVIAIAHLIMILALFLLYEHITCSSRMASIAAIIYIANPQFLFFDRLYNYETLALPLALLTMYILARYGNANKNQRWVIGAAWIVLLAITITHHMTTYVFIGLLLLWTGVSFLRPASRHTRIYLTAIATSGLLLALAYAFLLPGNPVWSYLTDYFGGAFNQLGEILTGNITARSLFTSSVHAAPIWDRLFMTGSVLLVMLSIPFGLLILLRLQRNNVLAITFGIVALCYPLSEAFRFTSLGTEITDRAGAFLFVPIAYVLTTLITHFWPTRGLNRRAIALMTGIIVVIFVGGVMVGSGPNLSGIPGPYLVSADRRSIEPEGIAVAIWSQAYLGPDNRIAADRPDLILMNSYGHQRMVTRLDDNVDVAPIFYSAQFDNTDIAILQLGQIQYLAIDTRISTALPLVGTYFENDRPTSIISRNALTKFNTVIKINKIFDSGDIVIYDTGAFIH